MEIGNPMCESEPCGRSAVVFGMKGSKKFRSCDEHISCLVTMKMQIFDIAGYSFISNLHDVIEFEDRRAAAKKGLKTLSVLTASCEWELSEALRAIERVKSNALRSVEQRCEEMTVAATEACSEAKGQLENLRGDFERFLLAKETPLSPAAQLACMDVSVNPRFLRFGIADLSDRIAALLSDSWMISNIDIHSTLKCLDAAQKKEAIDIALAEATDRAKKGIQEALQYADLLIGEAEMYQQAKENVMVKLSNFEKKRMEENKVWLQSSWDLRQRYECSASATISVGQQLATLLYRQFGAFSDAEEVLRRCYDIAQLQSTQSEDALALCTDICSLYLANAQYGQLESLGLWVLETFTSAGNSAEFYWTILFNLACSMRERPNTTKFNEVFEKWKEFRAEAKLVEMLQLLTFAMRSDSSPGAEKWLVQASHIGKLHFPTSVFTAFALFQLAKVSKENAQENLHRQAEVLYDMVAPMSLHAAMNLTSFGDLCQARELWNKAEQCYRKAQSILKATAARSMAAAICLSRMGDLFTTREQWSVAEESRQRARLAFRGTAPKSSLEAASLSLMASMDFGSERWQEAEVCYLQARSIFEAAGPCSVEAAGNLTNMGKLLSNNQKLAEAQECYQRALAIFEVAAPMSASAAFNLVRMGELLYEKQCWRQAEECCRRACSIYEVAAPRSVDAANSRYNLGVVLEAMGQIEQAIEYLSQAERIYEEIMESRYKEDTQNTIARLRRKLIN